MMKTRNIVGMIAAVALSLGVAACSDNYNTELEPSQTPTTLSALIGGEDLRKLSFDAGPKDTTINVVSNTRWAVELSDGGWCSVDVVNGSGNKPIRFSVLEDMTADRNCTLTLYKLNAQNEKIDDGKWQIAISQEASDVKLSPSDIEPFGAQPLNEQEFRIIANAAWTLSVNYEVEDVHFISIVQKSGMTDKGDGTYSGNSNATFSISLQNNGTAAVRRATLELKSEAGSYSVVIIQQKSENTFDVSPNSTRYVEAAGDTLDFYILSQEGWSVKTTEVSWISFSENGRDVGSEDRVVVKAYISPNADGTQRRGVIHFIPDKPGYVPVDVEVVQSCFDVTFAGSISEGEDRFSEAGGALFYNLDSRFDWKVTAADWIKVSPAEGVGSQVRQTIEMSVAVNNSYQSRSDYVTITPLETAVKEGVSINPSRVGVSPIKVLVEQVGGHEAAISRPWIGDVYEDEKVMVKYNFYSPSFEVKEAGLRWKKATDSDWVNMPSLVPSDPNSATVSFLIEDLQPVTEYVAQGYLIFSNGETKNGTISYSFTTSGRFPDKGDNSPVEK